MGQDRSKGFTTRRRHFSLVCSMLRACIVLYLQNARLIGSPGSSVASIPAGSGYFLLVPFGCCKAIQDTATLASHLNPWDFESLHSSSCIAILSSIFFLEFVYRAFLRSISQDIVCENLLKEIEFRLS